LTNQRKKFGSGRSAQLGRKPGFKKARGVIWIYCEGAVTEKTYFDDLRSKLRGANKIIKVTPINGIPLGIVQAAIDNIKYGEVDERIDSSWCVFDIESPIEHPKLDEALRLADRSNINLAMSNPCFETWLLLHHCEHLGEMTSTAAKRSLAQYETPPFKRTAAQFYFGRLNQASTRAKNLSKRFEEGSSVRLTNPGTDVWKLIEELFPQ
jgi:hypothetical protein